MKMVIADDESLVRVSLTSMIKDMEGPWQIVSEATNGEELLEAVVRHKPSIAIVDIRMPKLSGLDAIRLGKEISPHTNWIILSGFSDFTYAKQALKFGVSEYLLKPVDPIELEKTLQHIYKDNMEYIVLLNQQFENNLFALCNGLTSLDYEERGSLLYQGNFIGWTFILDTSQPASSASEMQREFYKKLRRSMDNHLVYGIHLALIALPNGELSAVGAWDPAQGEEGQRRVANFFNEIQDIISRYRNERATVTVLQTGVCPGFKPVNERLQLLQKWSGLRAVCGIGGILAYEQLQKETETPHKAEAARLLCSIGQHLRDKMYLNYQNAVNELEALLQKTDVFDCETTRSAFGLYLSCALGLDLPQLINSREMVGELRRLGETVLRTACAKEPNSADLVRQVIQYLEKHYMDDIGIGQIAGQLNVSANYLSALFHKKTGVMFVKYLTKIRMLKAKELLINTNLQVRQVAEQVGYYSTRHFTKLFTQSFGHYPSDYRKSQPQPLVPGAVAAEEIQPLL